MKHARIFPSSRRDAAALEQRRQRAARLFRKGIHDAEIARRLAVTRTAVHKWHITWKRGGLKGLRSHGHPGPQSQLTPKKIVAVRRALLKGPLIAGYATDCWTLERIQKLIYTVANVSYHPGHVWKILGALGWTCQKPETRAKERDERAIKRWREETWPTIQKKGQKMAHTSAF